MAPTIIRTVPMDDEELEGESSGVTFGVSQTRETSPHSLEAHCRSPVHAVPKQKLNMKAVLLTH